MENVWNELDDGSQHGFGVASCTPYTDLLGCQMTEGQDEATPHCDVQVICLGCLSRLVSVAVLRPFFFFRFQTTTPLSHQALANDPKKQSRDGFQKAQPFGPRAILLRKMRLSVQLT
jgi:hypothetical protein